MDSRYDTFGGRVDGAIEHLTPAQLAALNARYPGMPGVRALVMTACGIPHLSILSDITADRKPGNKYHQALASVLGVNLAWLEGVGGEAPDWALSPLEAWRRFEDRLRRAGDVIDEDESEYPGMNRRFRVKAAALAKAYNLDVSAPFIQSLVHGHYAEVPFDVALAYGLQIGIPPPTHPDHLRTGHGLWLFIQAELQREFKAVRKRFHRYIPPPNLFAAMRQALVDAQKPKTAEATADALEMLWRQQWLLAGNSRGEVPETLFEDTGRKRWRKLDEIRERWIPIEMPPANPSIV